MPIRAKTIGLGLRLPVATTRLTTKYARSGMVDKEVLGKLHKPNILESMIVNHATTNLQ